MLWCCLVLFIYLFFFKKRAVQCPYSCVNQQLHPQGFGALPPGRQYYTYLQLTPIMPAINAAFLLAPVPLTNAPTTHLPLPDLKQYLQKKHSSL